MHQLTEVAFLKEAFPPYYLDSKVIITISLGLVYFLLGE